MRYSGFQGPSLRQERESQEKASSSGEVVPDSLRSESPRRRGTVGAGSELRKGTVVLDTVSSRRRSTVGGPGGKEERRSTVAAPGSGQRTVAVAKPAVKRVRGEINLFFLIFYSERGFG